MTSWRRPGRSGAVLHGVLAAVFGGALGMVSRLRLERGRGGTDRAADSLDAAAEALASGEAIGLFPEGRITRHVDHWTERARTGAVRLALRTGAPIVPIDVGRLVDDLRTAGTFTRSAEAVDDGAHADGSANTTPDPDVVRSATDSIMATLIDLVEEVRAEVAPDQIGVEPIPSSGVTGPGASELPAWRATPRNRICQSLRGSGHDRCQ